MTWCLRKTLISNFGSSTGLAVRNEVYSSKMKAKNEANFNNTLSLPETGHSNACTLASPGGFVRSPAASLSEGPGEGKALNPTAAGLGF